MKAKKVQSRKKWVSTMFFDSLEALMGLRNYIYFSIAAFFAFAIVAFFYPQNFEFIDRWISELVERTRDLTGIEMIAFIFFNNLQSAFFAIMLGFFLSLFPLIALFINGSVLGYVYSKVYAESGVSDFWLILPHGIFELPAIFIAFALGIKN